MPRDLTYILNLQKQRAKKLLRTANYSNCHKISLHVLGSGARGAPACLFVSTDQSAYMFNCGEGTQRIANEHHFKLTRIAHIFVTQAKWKNLGGVPGLLLTAQDHGVPKLGLHGPKGTYDLLGAVKRFVNLPSTEISEEPENGVQTHQNSAMVVSYVPISKESEEVEECRSLLVDDTEYYSYSNNNENGKRPSSPVSKWRKVRKVEKKIKRITDVMCYICITHPKAGTLSLEKCVAAGLKPGPNFGLLKSGQDVELEDGRIVRSKDVCDPESPGIIFMVIDCPTEEYLDSFVSNSAFAKYQETANENEQTRYVFHFTPDEIIKHPRYQEWIKKFSPTTEHIILNNGNRCMGSEAVHKTQHQLHLLHPEIFPLIKDYTLGKEEEFENPRLRRAKTLQVVNLRPTESISNDGVISLHPEAYKEEILTIDGFTTAHAELQKSIQATTDLVTDQSDYPRIVMLGTASSIPSKVRNTSGILIRIDETHSILMDCGEGTFTQLVRFFGIGLKDILPSIKVIYVSHLHADHHLGLISLLNERSKYTKEPIYLVAPEKIDAWLQFYDARFEQISHLYTLVSNHSVCLNKRTISPTVLRDLTAALNIQDITTVNVNHCWEAYGVRLNLTDGKKVVYSGDTMPCEGLVELGRNCDLLIHEATMEDDLLQEARLKCHSTTSQAIKCGNLMNAKFLLLTHFSQRYSKLPQIPEGNNVGIAYDLMEIKFPQLSVLPLLYPCLKLMFGQYYAVMEQRALRRSEKLMWSALGVKQQ